MLIVEIVLDYMNIDFFYEVTLVSCLSLNHYK